jgi:nicotinate phosphoribosyltransferase
MDLKSVDLARYSDQYFINAREACAHAGVNPRVLYQVFQRYDAVLCGIKHVMDLLGRTGPEVEIWGLRDGDRIAPLEPVMHIIGPAQELFLYETLYLGLLARMTRVATNVRQAVEAANGKPVLFFPARFDVPDVQEYDGYAARVGGASGCSTPVEAEAFGGKALGTVPHALIAAFKGDTAAACVALAEACPDQPVWALVDFENDSAKTALEVYRAFRERGLKLAGIRLDTSQDLIDQGVAASGSTSRGVSPELARHVRAELDRAGAHDVKIAVSGGFNPERIRSFETLGAPVDVYAVGEQFFRGAVPFTSDVVGYFEGDKLIPCAKTGRSYKPSDRLQRLK